MPSVSVQNALSFRYVTPVCLLSCHECYAHAKVLKFAGRKEYYKNKLREMTGMFNIKVIDYFSEFSEWYIAAIEETIKNKQPYVDLIKNIFAYGDKEYIGSIAKSWYAIQKTDNRAYHNNQNILTIMKSKKRKRELLKMVL